MNNEEKKAVEIIKKEITRPDKTPLEVYVTDIKMLLHLIEKQDRNSVSKDKIKAKIEEISGMNKISGMDAVANIVREMDNRYEYAIKVLQELLEE